MDLDKRGISNEEIETYELKQKEIHSRNKLTKKIRITSGGCFRDFEEIEEATKHLLRGVLNFSYASMNVVYPELFWPDGKCPPITLIT